MVQLLQTKKTLEKSRARSGGQSIVEILVAIGLMAVLLPAILTGFVASRESKPQEQNRVKAVGLIRELEESIKSIRKNDWDNISTNIVMGSTYHPEVSGSSWVLVSGTENVDGFTRQVVFSDVQRDLNGVIVNSGGTNDPSTKMAVSIVSWAEPIASSVESTTYLSRYISNAAWEQTTQAEFDTGSLTDVVTTNNSGGEVELDISGAPGDWASPTIVDTYNHTSISAGNDVYVDGNYAYLGSPDNGAGPDLAIIDISDPTNISETGTFDVGDDVNQLHANGDFVYLATSAGTQELKVIDVSTKSSPSQRGTINLGGKNDAFSLFVSGNYAYVGKDAEGGNNRELYVVDISDPDNISEEGSLETGSDVNDIFVLGNFAYLATSGNSKELIIADISNPASPSEVGSYNADSVSNGLGIFVEGTTAYLTTLNNGGGTDPEFYILDVSNPSSVSLIGSYDVTNDTDGIFVVNSLAFLAPNVTSQQFTAIDISDPSNPSSHSTLDLGSVSNSIYISGDYAYVATSNASAELTVIEGGFPYLTSGTFESQTFDAAGTVAFNYFDFSITEPAGNNINFQVAVGASAPPTSFVGPDGTSSTYYETSGATDLSAIIGRYFRVIAYFTGSGIATPILNDFSINYSP